MTFRLTAECSTELSYNDIGFWLSKQNGYLKNIHCSIQKIKNQITSQIILKMIFYKTLDLLFKIIFNLFYTQT